MMNFDNPKKKSINETSKSSLTRYGERLALRLTGLEDANHHYNTGATSRRNLEIATKGLAQNMFACFQNQF